MAQPYKNFKDFYGFYLSQHQNTNCQVLHFIGTTFVLFFAYEGITTGIWEYFVLMPVVYAAFGWVAHSYFEHNTPPSLRYPLQSFAAHWVMYWHIISLQFHERMEEALAKSSHHLVAPSKIFSVASQVQPLLPTRPPMPIHINSEQTDAKTPDTAIQKKPHTKEAERIATIG